MAASVPGLKAGAAFPILAGDKVLGVLDFAGADNGIPEAELVRTLTALARQIGLWLERCRADAESRQETRKLRIVNRALTEYLVSMSWQRAADEMLKGALELTGSSAGYVGVVVDDRLRVLASSGAAWDELVPHEPFNRVITGKSTVATNEPAPGHPAITAFLGVPVVVDGTVVGVFGMANRAGGYDRIARGALEALGAVSGALCQHYRQQHAGA